MEAFHIHINLDSGMAVMGYGPNGILSEVNVMEPTIHDTIPFPEEDLPLVEPIGRAHHTFVWRERWETGDPKERTLVRKFNRFLEGETIASKRGRPDSKRNRDRR